MWARFNPNPSGRNVGDCAVRAIAKAMNTTWEDAYSGLAVEGMLLHDMPSANAVWGSFLRNHGYEREIVPNTCPDCYTLNDFCADHPQGMFIVALDNHVVAVCDGSFYDTWDSGNEIPIYFYKKTEE